MTIIQNGISRRATLAQLAAFVIGTAPVASATLSGVPSTAVADTPISGVSASLSPTGATGYIVLYTGGADVGARAAFMSAVPSLIPAGAGSYTIRIYSAASGGTLLVESAVIAVSASTYAAYGVPSRGLGFTAYPADAGFDAEWDGDISASTITATSMGTSGGAFDTLTNMVNYNDQHASQFATNTRTNGGMGYPKTIPVLGFTNCSTSGDITFASVLTGVNDAQLKALVNSWMSRGYMEIWIRIGYEDNFPTTPASQNADHGAFNFAGPYPPSATASDGGAAYKAAYLKSWRKCAKVFHDAAIAAGGVVKTIWGPTFINNCPLDGRTFYPDGDQSDGNGKQVDFHGPDLYSNSFYGPFVTPDNTHFPLRTGYDLMTPFTAFASIGNATSVTSWAQDRGSKWYQFDFIDGNTKSPTLWNGGWSMFEAMYFALNCPSGPCPMLFPEHGVITSWDGGGNGGLTDANGAGYDPDLAAYVRSRVAWFQQQGGTFIAPVLWRNLSPAMLATYGTTFPELVTGYTGSKVSPPLISSGASKSVSGTLISTIGPTFTDSYGTKWSIGNSTRAGAGRAMFRNGTDTGNTVGVTAELYFNKTVWYNNGYDWFSLNPDGSALAGHWPTPVLACQCLRSISMGGLFDDELVAIIQQANDGANPGECDEMGGLVH